MKLTPAIVLAKLSCINSRMTTEEKMKIVDLMFDTFERHVQAPKFRLEPQGFESLMPVDKYLNTTDALLEGLGEVFQVEEEMTTQQFIAAYL